MSGDRCPRLLFHDLRTGVTACTVAPPPYVGFIVRLRPSRFPTRALARNYQVQPTTSLGWVLPIWSENWICMKMRYFATAAPQSR